VRHLLLLSGLLSLAGCATGPQQPITPVAQVCRSCEPHQIKGVWYYPQLHYDYEEEGRASWYGPGFHGQPKAYGEIYNQEGISVAHRTLPLPTVALVTNLENGQSKKVLVCDRGPYAHTDDRIIDLSKGVARELGVLNAGLARVNVKALPEESRRLSHYLGRFGRRGIDPSGRNWETIYKEEIAPHFEGDIGESQQAVYVEPTPMPILQAAPPAPAAVQMVEVVHKSHETPKPHVAAPPIDTTSLDQMIDVAYRQEHTPSRASSSPKKPYFVEVGHYMQKKNADNALAELRPIARGEVKSFMADKQQRLYAVKLGPFPSLSKANAAARNLEAIGYNLANVKDS
jgi:rare lipoprotein A